MLKLIDLKAGDQAIWRSSADHRRAPHAVTIDKVTKTHIHVGRQKFLRDTGWQTGTQYTPDRIYASVEEIEQERRMGQKHLHLLRLVNATRAPDFTEEQLDALIAQFTKECTNA